MIPAASGKFIWSSLLFSLHWSSSVDHSSNVSKQSFWYDFFRILIRYTKKMPQVSTDTLLEIGKKMAAIGTKCCHLAEDKRLPCSEGYVSTFVYSLYSSWRFLLSSKMSNSGEAVNTIIFHKPQAKHLPNRIWSLFIFNGYENLIVLSDGRLWKL